MTILRFKFHSNAEIRHPTILTKIDTKRRVIDLDQRREALRVDQVEASLDRIDVFFADFNRSLERICTSAIKLSSDIYSHSLSPPGLTSKTDFALARPPPPPHPPSCATTMTPPKSSPTSPARRESSVAACSDSVNTESTSDKVRPHVVHAPVDPHSVRDQGPVLKTVSNFDESEMDKLLGEIANETSRKSTIGGVSLSSDDGSATQIPSSAPSDPPTLSVKIPGLKLIAKDDPALCSQAVQCNVTEGFDPKFVISGDEVNVTHGDRESRSQAAHSQRQRGKTVVIVEVANIELLKIRGARPKNLRTLADKEFRGIFQLKQLYRDKFYGECNQKVALMTSHPARDLTSATLATFSTGDTPWQKLLDQCFRQQKAF
ncbi:hypothetical protein IEQ34_018963 [Dendrobium chrysotoxum]|uniref:Uncharacterized protein n=1 Tax=Dendrobium chrysotoxum TaxID=161865 RepID=A0AAV7FPX4_DENCH|nr:hypothetical protein IEQ34_018963 [Dendrobium chrysotoxum]